MANVDQNGLHERRLAKEEDGDPRSKAEPEVNFDEQRQHKKKKTYGRTPDGTGMRYTCRPRMVPGVMACYHRVIFQELTCT